MLHIIDHSKILPSSDRVIIFWLGGAGFLIKYSDGFVICVDPYLSDSAERLCGFKRLCPAPINKDATWEDIDKDKIRAFFKEAKVGYSKIEAKSVLGSLNLSKKDEIKNAGILFFAKDPRKLISQCQMTMVAFKGKERIHIYDRKEIQDDLLAQFNEAELFLKKHLNVRSEIKGMKREDIYEIPLEALREGVANAIIHRDYCMRGTSIMVEVHEDRVVISNPGGLLEGLSLRSLLNVSVRRNELIADMFARMEKVERMGTGIRRMRDAMKTSGLALPKIESNLFFTITFMRPLYSLKESAGSEIGSEKSSEKILSAIESDRNMSASKLAVILGISRRAIEKQIAKLKSEGKLKRVGSAKGGYWEIMAKKKTGVATQKLSM